MVKGAAGGLVDIKKLEKEIKKAGFSLEKKSEYHYQAKGIYVVNIYPTKSTIYIAGMNKKIGYGGPDQVVRFLTGAPKMKRGQLETVRLKPKEKRKPMKSVKDKLWNTRKCFYCGKEILNYEEASVEHKIPLSKGGSNRMDNLALSHKKCNQERGSSLKIKAN